MLKIKSNKAYSIFLVFVMELAFEASGQQCGITTTGSTGVSSCSFRRRLVGQSNNTNPHPSPIVGGVPVTIESYPWQVQLYEGDIYLCGGSIIGPKHVITAAHCLEVFLAHRSKLKVLVSRNRLNGTGPPGIPVAQAFTHPNFSPFTKDSDIAVLVLESAIEFNERARPVCLPSGESGAPPALGTSLYISGYGFTGEDAPSSDALRAVCMPVQETSQCEVALGSTLTSSMFCAGYYNESKDSCLGDSGGPLVEVNNGRATLRGVISWGRDCGNGFPSVNTNVALFVDWTNEVVDGCVGQ